ncbi:MAG TPA: WhiB family transcriptional regulator [Streptosporangiaceae bacterium]|jgi:WhiB family redox-sensing transcriptional regulator|nr:WhiB family transcriptional regulator [Streptosporangiaceae bacterium]
MTSTLQDHGNAGTPLRAGERPATAALAGAWAQDALCAQADPDAWFPEQGRTANMARRICAACPVRVPCLDYALSGADTWAGITTGIWGGTTPRQRAAIRRARAGKAAAA